MCPVCFDCSICARRAAALDHQAAQLERAAGQAPEERYRAKLTGSADELRAMVAELGDPHSAEARRCCPYQMIRVAA